MKKKQIIKNSTIAFLLAIVFLLVSFNHYSETSLIPTMFDILLTSIFFATYLIIKTINKEDIIEWKKYLYTLE